MPRPTKPDSLRRRQIIRVYFNPAELTRVQTQAKRAKSSLAHYLRRCALGKKIPAPIPGRNLLAWHQLWRVKSNASQIAAVLRVYRSGVPAARLLARLHERTERVRQALVRRPWPRFEPWPWSPEPKQCAVKIRTTKDERSRIAACAEMSGGTVSGFVRVQALRRQAPPQPAELAQPLFESLYQIQSQWNQMAYAANTGRFDQIDLSIVDRFHSLYDQVVKALA